MKRTTKHEQERPEGTRRSARDLEQADLARVVGGDAYILNPRGSNDRSSSGG